MIYQLGFALSTFYGVYVSEKVGFRLCCDYIAFACVGVGLLYLVSTKDLPKREFKINRHVLRRKRSF